MSSDPAIALKVLRLVNSAYYGVRQEVKTVEHAVSLLGIKVVKNLALTATVFDTMKASTGQFLHHSLACGIAMRILVEGKSAAHPLVSSDEAFVIGLLHDIGKMLLEEFLPHEYADVARNAQESGVPWHVSEIEVIGVDHALLGGRLVQKWKLPAEFAGALEGHHDVERCGPAEHRILAATLCIADFLCGQSGWSAHANPVYAIPDPVWRAAAVDNESLARMCVRFFNSQAAIDELLQLAS